MEPHNTPVYKNYLPSKKIGFLVLGIIGIGLIITLPKIILQAKQSRVSPSAPTPTTIVVGDPTTRDSDGDGIYDWQEIAIGLDPTISETVTGVADTISFENLTEQLSSTTRNLFENTPDSTKLSYTIYKNATLQSNGTSITDEALANSFKQELTNYIVSLAPEEKYTPTNLPRKPSTPEYDAEYLATTKTFPLIDLFSPTTQRLINDYLTTGANKPAITKKIQEIRSTLALFEKIPVPESIFEEQRGVFNALYAIATLLENYDPTSTDGAYLTGYNTLIQSYQMSIIKNTTAVLTYYKDPRAVPITQALQKITNPQ